MPILKVKQNSEWINVGSVQGGITVDTENTNIGTPNGINADTLGGNTLQQIMLAMYPVGAIYMSANAVSPADLFGGTWEQIHDTFLLAAGSSYAAGSTGGEATHTLTIEEMPSHSHSVLNQDQSKYTTPQGSIYGLITAGAATNTGTAGGNKSHNNMPPYLAVYMWRRVS